MCLPAAEHHAAPAAGQLLLQALAAALNQPVPLINNVCRIHAVVTPKQDSKHTPHAQPPSALMHHTTANTRSAGAPAAGYLRSNGWQWRWPQPVHV
jgi:hypothetical protein